MSELASFILIWVKILVVCSIAAVFLTFLKYLFLPVRVYKWFMLGVLLIGFLALVVIIFGLAKLWGS